MPVLSVREMQASDIPHIIRYWLESSPEYMQSLGVDMAKMPAKSDWEQILSAQLTQDYPAKTSYCMIWEADGKPVGHSNVNKIVYGESAYMHLHLWPSDTRRRGWGLRLVQMTLPYFFERLHLKTLYCEPYAHNPAPNKTLAKAGFTFVKTHRTTPGLLNFEQEANLWKTERPA